MTTLPCTWCADVDRDCATCTDYGAWLATLGQPEPCLMCVDVDWLTASGELFEQVAARLHVLPGSLETHLRRHGRSDLIPHRREARV